MDLSATGTAAAVLIDRLPALPRPWSVTELCARLERKRGKRLVVHLLDLAALPSGLWYDDGRADHIICRHGITGYHRDHVILHEICHLLAGHGPAGPEPHADLASAVASHAVRTRYTAFQEEVAETFASKTLKLAKQRPSAHRSLFERRAAVSFGLT
ncbi:hypothetical protein [Amycolatopsis sp. lyj-112]|uniref:hypothetical protein n=1 Tax=Amycolatopsis sp. lyj-112 TaxID=2789288 RepID=UPI00397D462D